MNNHIFEYPLQEKLRTYLRIETLLLHARSCAFFNHANDHLLFFRSLFDLQDLLEQIQLKKDLAQRLEAQRITYKNWQNVDGIQQDKLESVLEDINDKYRHLMVAERFGDSLKADRFLANVRQKFTLPGCCGFDNPSLDCWVHQPIEVRRKNAEYWLGTLKDLEDSLLLLLALIRESGSLHTAMAKDGFYQQETDSASLIRLTLPSDLCIYPSISGHKHRFSINFIAFETGLTYAHDVDFNLCVC